MDEKRKDRRLDLDVAIQMERLDLSDGFTPEMIHVKVTDMSSSGMGFRTMYPLEEGAMYNTKITIWTKEVLQTVIRIVRCEKVVDDLYQCGAAFVGLSSADELKINIYGMLNPEE